MSKSRRGRLTVRRRRLRRTARRALWTAVSVAIVAALALADRAGLFGRATRSDWEKYHGRQFKVVRVIDGDTLDVNCPDGRFRRTRIRLWGVDTPETVTPDTPVEHFGPEATAFTRSATLGKTVTLKLYRLRTRGTYKRLLAYVTLPDGTDLSQAIIATGHGYADPRFDHPRKREFRSAQRQARQSRHGLWRQATDADLPYYYRGKLKLPAAPATYRPR